MVTLTITSVAHFLSQHLALKWYKEHSKCAGYPSRNVGDWAI